MSNPGNSVSRTHGNYFLMKWMGSYIWDEHGKTNKPMIPMWRQICHGRVWDQPTKVHTMYSLYHFIPTPPGAGKHFFGRRNRPNSAWRRPCFCFYVQQLPWEVRRSKRNGSTTTKNKRHCFVQRCFLSHMNNYYNHPNTLQMSSDCSSDTVFWPSNFESKCLHRGHNLTIQEISLHFKKCHDHLQYSTLYKSYVGAAIDIYRLSSTSSLDGEGLWELRFRTVEGP